LKICEIRKGYEYEGPRFIRLGPFSGEEFREKYLMPWLNTLNDQEGVVIDFEGTKVYSPSFLEECFGGSIRGAKNDQEAELNRKKLLLAEFANIDLIWKEKLVEYIKDAKYKVKNNTATLK